MELIASGVMKRRVVSVGPELPLPDLEQKFLDEKVGGFPVIENDRLLGMVTRTDVVRQIDLEQDLAESVSDFYMDEDGFHEVPLTNFKQVATRVGERLENLKVKDVMCHKIISVDPHESIQMVAQVMSRNRIHRILVTKDDQLVGIISTLDIARLLADGVIGPIG